MPDPAAMDPDAPRPPAGPADPAPEDPAPVFGAPVPGWCPPAVPGRASLHGRWCRVEPLDPARHADDLFAANAADRAGALWAYMSYGPFEDPRAWRDWLERHSATADPQAYAIVPARSGRAEGLASFLRIAPTHGSIEIGHLVFAPSLQRTPAATEAMVLMMQRAFALGYRRLEWKCDALNRASRQAALRLGFTFEGVFRQATVTKGRNRDTAWYAVIDRDWPTLAAVLAHWLEPGNFDAQGRQSSRLSELTRRVTAPTAAPPDDP